MKNKFCIFILVLAIQFLKLNNTIAQVIAGGGYHCLVRCDNGAVKSWGYNISGALGDGTTTMRKLPVSVSVLSNMVMLSGGDQHSLGLKSDGSVWVCGRNVEGQLGDSTNTGRLIYKKLNGLNNMIGVYSGYDHSLAIKNDGTAWVWGSNQFGQLGDGTITNSPFPIQVMGLTDVISLAGGSYHSVALKSDGTVWTWGYNGHGELGDGTTTVYKTAPVQALGLSNIIAIAAVNYHTIALKSDGTVWTWGNNSMGELGDSTTTSSNIPQQVAGITNIVSIEAGSYQSFAIKDDGTVWGWGGNNDGELGNGTYTTDGIPTLIPGFSGVVKIASMNDASIALKSDGTIWSWGDNFLGQLADGGLVPKRNFPGLVSLCNVVQVFPVFTSQINIICSDSLGSATAYPVDSQPPYTYSWSNGQTTQTALNLVAGSYTVTVTDSSGFVGTSTVTITGASVNTTVLNTNVSCNGGNNGAINITTAGGIGSFSYQWSTGATTEDLTGLTAGTYTLTTIDAGCADTLINTMVISQPTLALSSSVSTTGSTCGYSNGSASVVTTGGTGPYNYIWSNGDITPNITNVVAGTYTVTITDANGCTNSNTAIVSALTPPVIGSISSQTNVLCNLDSNGSATVTVSSGTPGYTYSWNTTPVQTTPTATNLSAGTYVVSISDANSCTSSNTVTITIISPINIVINSSAISVLPGTSVTLSGAGATSYSWSGGITNAVPFIPGTSNTYTVTASDGGGCTAQASVTVSVLNQHKLIAGGGSHSVALCASGTVKAWGYNNYGQIGDATTIDRHSPTNVSSISGMIEVTAGYYFSVALKNNGTVWAWGRNNSGQLGIGSFSTVWFPVQMTGMANIVSIAAGNEHALLLKSNGTVWACGKNSSGQLGDGTTITRNTCVQVIGLTNIVAIAAGDNHSLALKNDGTVWGWGFNGWSQLATNSTGPFTLPIQLNGLSEIISLAGGANHTLALKNDGTVWACGINNNGELGDGTIFSSYIPVQVSGITNVDFIAAGMSHSLATKVDGSAWGWGLNGSGQVGDGSTINRTLAVAISGLAGVEQLSGGAAHTIAQKNDGSIYAGGLNFAGQIGDGTYLNYRYTPVTVSGLCSVHLPLSVGVNSSSATCSTSNNGTATVVVTGGVAPYSYLWSNGQTAATATSLAAGSYTVTITDAVAATSSAVVTITAGLSIIPFPTSPSCFGLSNGFINLNLSGGSGDFSFLWSDGTVTQNNSGLVAGTYTVVVNDNICGNAINVVTLVNQPAALSVSASAAPATCGTNNGTAVANITGGTSPYHYLWSNGQISSSISSLFSGTYTVQIIDNNGCQDSATVNISALYGPVVATTSSISPVCSGGNNGSATATPTSGTGPFNYSWNSSPAQFTQTATNLIAGQYIVTVMDANGCTDIDTIFVNPTPPVPVVANSTATIILPGSAITLTGSGANTYSWSSGVINGNSFVPTATTTYTVSGYTTEGCSNTSTIKITLKVKHRTIASGNSFSLAICNDSLGISWGFNAVGQLGNGLTVNAPIPVSILNLYSLTDLAAGQSHAFAILNNGDAYSWGFNNQGELGIGNTINQNIPQLIGGLSNVIDIAGGVNFGIALKTDGTVWGWGWNGYGNLGDSSNVSTTSPVMIPGFKDVIAVSAGYGHALALKNDGTVWSWGGNNNGELGDSTIVSRNYPVKVKGLSNVVDISTMGATCLVVKNDGTVWGWGSNYYGELGIGMSPSPYYYTYPVKMDSITNAIAVSSGSQYSLILSSGGIVHSTGRNDYGQLGDGTASASISRFYPYQITSLTNVTEIAAGYLHAACKRSNKTYRSWGRNWSGGLGDGSGVDQYLPVVVAASPSCITAGIQDFNVSNNSVINIYPNPSSGNFMIDYTNYSQEFNVEIFNLLGEKVFQSKINNQTFKIDLSSQPNGIYFIKIDSENGKEIKKFVIQK